MRTSLALEPNVTCGSSGGVATITVGDGERLNALRSVDWAEVGRIADAIGRDDSVRSVVVRGHGPAFCSGSDLHEWAESTDRMIDESFALMERAFRAVEAIPVPTVAHVQRVAAGAGCQLALACDVQLLEESSSIGMPILRLGILTPPSFAERLSTRVGPSRAKAMLFDGALLPAARAERIGLVTHTAPDAESTAALASMLATWSSMPARALRAAKASVAGSGSLAGSVDEGFTERVSAFLRGRR